MSHMAFSRADRQISPAIARVSAVVSALLVGWLALVVWLGASGAFETPLERPPLPLLLAVTVPLAAFLTAWRMSGSLRDALLGAHPVLIIGPQAWRFAGFGFLALNAHGVLPGYFTWPAGLGDMAIGVTALWVLSAAIRQPTFTSSRTFVAWNLLGIADLVVAVATGALGSLIAANAGAIPTAPMARLPLVLIPAFFVPLFVILHIVALAQAKARRGA